MPDEALTKLLTDTAVPPANLIGKLPRITCRNCSQSSSKVCQEHSKSQCQVCNNYITGRHIHLDYLGHAEVTRLLIEHDPEWSWEPVAWEQGRPAINVINNHFVMWGRLTVLGVTRVGVGVVEAGKPEADKELIGDFLRNAAMRFGVGLSLWSKQDWPESSTDETPAQSEGLDYDRSSHPPAASPDWREKFKAACAEANVDLTEVCLQASDGKLSLPDQFRDEERFKLGECLKRLQSAGTPVPAGAGPEGIPSALGSRARK